MSHRKNLTLLLLAALLCMLLSACQRHSHDHHADDQQVFNWKLVTSWPKHFPALGIAPERLAEKVKTMSNGRLNIKVYAAGELVPALEVFDSVSRGTVEMGHSAAYYWKGRMPAAQFFTTVPFGFTAQEMNAWLYHGGGLQLWQDLYRKEQVIPFPGGNSGVQMAGWFNKKIESVEDFKGLKMRIPGLGAEVLAGLGGAPVILPGGEIFTSLQSGVIDATEWLGPYNDTAFGLSKAAKYYYYPGWHEPGAVLEFDVNQKAYDALPEDLKAILVTAMESINQDMLSEYTVHNSRAYADLLQDKSLQILPLPDDVLKALHQASQVVLSELGKKNDTTKAIYQSMTAFLAEVSAYDQISEEKYLTTRSAL